MEHGSGVACNEQEDVPGLGKMSVLRRRVSSLGRDPGLCNATPPPARGPLTFISRLVARTLSYRINSVVKRPRNMNKEEQTGSADCLSVLTLAGEDFNIVFRRTTIVHISYDLNPLFHLCSCTANERNVTCN